MRILVTGGCGFIGSNFVRYLLNQYPDDEVINLDLLTYAGNFENLADVEANYRDRYSFIQGDISEGGLVLKLVDRAEAIVHFAAESHVDRSIKDAAQFVHTNVLGTQTLLQAACQGWGYEGNGGGVQARRRFIYISTDEVYGTLALNDGYSFREDWPLDPRSPYSASKAGADHLARAFYHTYGLPVIVTRSSNNYGPYQFPEKFIPLMIINAVAGRELPIYGDGLYVRDWLHVFDHCRATDLVLRQGRPGEVYNIGANSERSNLEVLENILDLVAVRVSRSKGELQSLIRHIRDRPGHDRRYAIDANKIQTNLGFSPQMTFAEGLALTVDWYMSHYKWCAYVISRAYQKQNIHRKIFLSATPGWSTTIPWSFFKH